MRPVSQSPIGNRRRCCRGDKLKLLDWRRRDLYLKIPADWPASWWPDGVAMGNRLSLATALGLALAGLTACVSPEELRRQDEAACASYGFKPGTSDFAGCLQRESLARRYQSYAPAYPTWGPPWGPYWWR